MSIQSFYFLGLTFLLVLYYIILISIDLSKHGKKGSSNEENIDIVDDEQMFVEETDEGFSVSAVNELPAAVDDGNQQSDSDEVSDGFDEKDISIDNEEEAIVVNEEDYVDNGVEYAVGSCEDVDDTIADIQQQMEQNLSDGDPRYQEVMDSVGFEVMMEQPRSTSSSSKFLKSYANE